MRRLVAAFSLIALVACDDTSPTAVASGFSGTYALQTVNGAALPIVDLQDGTRKRELMSDVLHFSADGAFTGRMVSRNTGNGLVTNDTTVYTGIWTWILNGHLLEIRFPRNEYMTIYVAVFGTSLMISSPAMTTENAFDIYLYARQ